MKKNILQVILAILLGLAVPGIIARLTVGPTVITPVTTTKPSEMEAQKEGLWVLTEGEKLQWITEDAYLTGVLLAEMPTSFEHNEIGRAHV